MRAPDDNRVATWLTWALLAGACGVSFAFAVTAIERSHFFSDDNVSLFYLRRDGPISFLLRPVNIQVVPLHRTVTWLFDSAFGYRFTPAVAMLLTIHLAGVALLYRVTRRLVTAESHHLNGKPGGAHRLHHVLPAVLTFCYASYPLIGVHFLWFASGLHRLPYALVTLLAFDQWLDYRQDKRPRHLVLLGLALVLAWGFYGKGPLLVPHVIALELCLLPRTPWAQAKRNLAVLTPFFVVAVALAAVGALFLELRPVSVVPKLSAVLVIEWEALRVFLRAFVGLVTPPPRAIVSDWGMAIVSALLLGAMVTSIRRSRANGWVWAVVAACIAGNNALAAVSNRGVFGMALAHAHRYYIDQLVVVIPMLAIPLASIQLPQRWRPVPAASLLCTLVALAGFNVANFSAALDKRYAKHAHMRRFFDKFEADLALNSAGIPPHTLVFQEELMPHTVQGMNPEYRTLEHMAIAMGKKLRFRPNGKLLIENDGSIWPKGPNYDPQRRWKDRRDHRARIQRLIERARHKGD